MFNTLKKTFLSNYAAISSPDQLIRQQAKSAASLTIAIKEIDKNLNSNKEKIDALAGGDALALLKMERQQLENKREKLTQQLREQLDSIEEMHGVNTAERNSPSASTFSIAK